MALVWRWTGDNKFRDEMYDFTVRNLKYVVNNLDADHDGWPEGSGNVERTGMGPEKVDNAVYLVRGLYDLADMAKSKHDGKTYAWAKNLADKLRAKFDQTWWYQAASQYADSLLDPGNVQSFQQYWIGQTPMEAELNINGVTVPGVAPYDHGNAALAGRENDCYSGIPPFNTGLFHTGCSGPPSGQGEKVIYGLTTSIQSVGEGNYGRLGPDQQQRYLDALTQTMFAEPATGGTPDEQPGAMPEIFPSPDQGANIDRCWTCRSMFMQAWGNYGTAWPAVHQWLGVRPNLGIGRGGRRSAGAGRSDHYCRPRHPAGQRLGRRARPTTPVIVTSPRSARTAGSAHDWCSSASRCRAAPTRTRCTWTGTRCATTGWCRPTAVPNSRWPPGPAGTR